MLFLISVFVPIGLGLNVTTDVGIEPKTILNEDGPLGEWPDFTPIGFITAPHPDNPNYQTHLYGDWGGIVGEEFIFLQDDIIKLLYHSYHETYMTDHPHEEDILSDWTLGYDPYTKLKYTPLVKPGGPYPGPAWEHTDTPGYIQHPITGEHLLYNTVRPGTKYLHPEWEGLPGWEGAIQVATSESPPTIGIPFDQTYENILVAEYWWEQGWNQDGVIKGGLSEPTPVWVPHLGDNGMIRLFYRGLHGSPGSYWNWRISYADSVDGKTDWIKNSVPTFDPSDPDNPAYQWTLPYPEGFSFRGAWQAHCTGDIRADGVHMVLCVSNQNYAGFGHIAYYWSPDWGDTWIGHPDNPIIAPGQFPNGVPPQGFQRTPTLMIDEEYERYILAYNAGHDINEKWKRRTYLATASRPYNPPPNKPTIYGPNFGIKGESYLFNASSTDPEGENIYYWFDWGDDTNSGWLGPYKSGETIKATHIWNDIGEYSIKVRSKDEYKKSNWSDPLIMKISNPLSAPIIDGPINGKTDIIYDFNFLEINPDAEDISFYIDWGDGTYSDWSSFYCSGEIFNANHTWETKGKYFIKAKVKNHYGIESGWGTWEFNVPRSRAHWIRFLDMFPVLQRILEIKK